MNVYVIRHTPVNVPTGTCYGHADVALTDDWPTHLERIRDKLPVDRITDENLFSSPLSRCLTLARELTPTPQVDDRLKEMNYGHWEGNLWSELDRSELDAWLADLENYRAPAGETLGEVHRRGVSFLNALHSIRDDAAFVVTHGGMVRCLVAHTIGLDVANAARLSVDYGGVTHIRLEPDWSRLECMNV